MCLVFDHVSGPCLASRWAGRARCARTGGRLLAPGQRACPDRPDDLHTGWGVTRRVSSAWPDPPTVAGAPHRRPQTAVAAAQHQGQAVRLRCVLLCGVLGRSGSDALSGSGSHQMSPHSGEHDPALHPIHSCPLGGDTPAEPSVWVWLSVLCWGSQTPRLRRRAGPPGTPAHCPRAAPCKWR